LKPWREAGVFNLARMETTEHEKFIRIAIELSEYNVKQAAGGPFGAVIVKDGWRWRATPIKLFNKMTLRHMPRYLLSGCITSN